MNDEEELTQDELVELLRKTVAKTSIVSYAESIGISPNVIYSVLGYKTKVPAKIFLALGYRKVTVYRKHK